MVSWDGGGNTPSAYNLGSWLVGRGHRVRMMGWPAMAAAAAQAGLEFVAYPSVPPWPAELRHEDGWEQIEVALFGTATEHDIVREARAFAADVFVVDCMLTAGYAAARGLGLPVVSLVHPLYSPFVHQWGSGILGVDVPTLLLESDSVLALQPPGFDEPTALPDSTAYVGAIRRPGPTPELEPRLATLFGEDGPPWVLLSLSTTLQGQRDSLPWFLDALASLPVRALLTLGGVLSPDSMTAPTNVTVCGHVPHESALPHVAAVVTHAGMGTVATTLAAGVPMVCVPQGREQPLNARQVATVGAGLEVAPDASPSDLASALQVVLSDARYRSAAQGFAAATAALGNGRRAADLAETRPRSRRTRGIDSAVARRVSGSEH
jgi:UDP:flavonoid glycosyltransferase YjiC (YdhE family)